MVKTFDETYLVCGCGNDCNWIDEAEPCWGQVEMEDDDDEGNQWHTCEGHREMLDWCRNSQTARKYIPPTTQSPKSQQTNKMPEPETNSTAIAGSSRTTCSPSYYPGRGCRCAARSEADCGCPGVDWSPSEIYDLRAMLRDARESLAFRRQLYRRQNALMNEMRERLERDSNQWETQCRVARIQRDNLAAALAEMRYGHTDKAERMAVSALSYLENAGILAQPTNDSTDTKNER